MYVRITYQYILRVITEHLTVHRKPQRVAFKIHAQPSPPAYKPSYLGNIKFNGRLISTRSTYACFMTFNNTKPSAANIPENLKVPMKIFLGDIQYTS